MNDDNYENMIRWYSTTLYCAIKGGKPLPKGHGDLIDANELCEGRVSNDPVVIAAKCATTIIEAGEEGEQ